MRSLAVVLWTLVIPAYGQALTPPEADPAGTALILDDDLFSGPGRDRDYTGGFAINISGERAARYVFSLDPALGKLDRAARLTPQSAQTSHALALGVIAFTPQNIEASEPVTDDRPYASMVFLSSARRYVMNDRNAVYNTTFVFGALGLSAVGSGHRALHKAASSDPLHGYSHQVSAGGEPTARYSIARQAPLGQPSTFADFKWTAAGSVGTVTETSLAVNGRWGHIRSPWWSFSPEQNLYLQDTQPLTSFADPERFFTAGARVKARAYNAFLQGQFRHSDVRQPARNINTLLAEAWAGVVMRQASGLEFRYLARWGSPELRHGPGARDLVWGSLEFVKPF